MAVRNNEVIGTVECNVCHQVASVHQVERGGRKGMLYIRGCDCKINQSTGAPFQEYWRENTKPRPGFEHLFPGTGTGDHSEIDQDNTENEETRPDQGFDQDQPAKIPGAAVGVIGLVFVSALALIGFKR